MEVENNAYAAAVVKTRERYGAGGIHRDRLWQAIEEAADNVRNARIAKRTGRHYPASLRGDAEGTWAELRAIVEGR